MKAINVRMAVAAAIALVSVAGYAASVPTTDFLHWTVQDAYNSCDDEAIYFSYATVSTYGGGGGSQYTLLTVWDADTGTDTGYTRVYGPSANSSSLYTTVFSGSFDKSSIQGLIIELWDDSHNRVAWQYYSTVTAKDYIWEAGSIEGGTAAKALIATNFVPEPSGGLLTLLGAAVLALRRRKREIQI